MKSKLLVLSVTVLAGAAWWTGCSSSSTDGGNAPTDAGGGTDSADTDSGGGTDSGGNTDAAKDTGVDSALSGPFVDLTYGTCATFTPCGGDPKGSWNVSGGCVSSSLFAAAKAQCAGAMESNVKFQARGTVVADATTVTRKTDVKFTASLAIPPECKAGAGSCATIGAVLKALAGLDTANCTDAGGGGCDCAVGSQVSDQSADAYTTSGNVLTTGSAANTRTFDYCVAGNKLDYTETTAKALPIHFELTK